MSEALLLSVGCDYCRDPRKMCQHYIDNAMAQHGPDTIIPERINCFYCKREVIFNLLPHTPDDERSLLYRIWIMQARARDDTESVE